MVVNRFVEVEFALFPQLHEGDGGKGFGYGSDTIDGIRGGFYLFCFVLPAICLVKDGLVTVDEGDGDAGEMVVVTIGLDNFGSGGEQMVNVGVGHRVTQR